MSNDQNGGSPQALDVSVGDMIDPDQYDWDEGLDDPEQSAGTREPASLRARRAIEKLREQRELSSLLVDFPD